MSRNEHLFITTLNEQKTRHIKNIYHEPGIDRWQAENLDCGELLMVPLISKNRRIGLLLADNIINGRPITAEDVQSIETFALPVSFAIERASLYERLQEELAKVTTANTQLREQQELIVRMEKMALVGKIASNIAHTIRNPLTIIGGFARSLMKNTSQEDTKRTYIESIIRETRRLEEVLQEVLELLRIAASDFRLVGHQPADHRSFCRPARRPADESRSVCRFDSRAESAQSQARLQENRLLPAQSDHQRH